jgi:hypothetical protein
MFCPAGKPFDGVFGLSTGANTCFVAELCCETETGLNEDTPLAIEIIVFQEKIIFMLKK